MFVVIMLVNAEHMFLCAVDVLSLLTKSNILAYYFTSHWSMSMAFRDTWHYSTALCSKRAQRYFRSVLNYTKKCFGLCLIKRLFFQLVWYTDRKSWKTACTLALMPGWGNGPWRWWYNRITVYIFQPTF